MAIDGLQYATFNFTVTYNDGTIGNGHVPYRGRRTETEDFTKFIHTFILSSKPIIENSLKITNVKKFTDAKKWLDTVVDWDSFKALRQISNFAGELMVKYYRHRLPSLD